MIELLSSPADNIVKFSASGHVTSDDYETVLIPAVERALSDHEKIRVLYQIGPDFEGYKGAAMWEDAKVGMKHFTHWERIAVVTDLEWIAGSMKAFGFLLPGEVRVYANADMDDANSWLAE